MTLSTDLPLPFPGWELAATPAMEQGRQVVAQCGHCGAVVIVGTWHYVTDKPQPSHADLGNRPCPACCSTAGWWRQDTPVGHSLAGWTFVGEQ